MAGALTAADMASLFKPVPFGQPRTSVWERAAQPEHAYLWDMFRSLEMDKQARVLQVRRGGCPVPGKASAVRGRARCCAGWLGQGQRRAWRGREGAGQPGWRQRRARCGAAVRRVAGAGSARAASTRGQKLALGTEGGALRCSVQGSSLRPPSACHRAPHLPAAFAHGRALDPAAALLTHPLALPPLMPPSQKWEAHVRELQAGPAAIRNPAVQAIAAWAGVSWKARQAMKRSNPSHGGCHRGPHPGLHAGQLLSRVGRWTNKAEGHVGEGECKAAERGL